MKVINSSLADQAKSIPGDSWRSNTSVPPNADEESGRLLGPQLAKRICQANIQFAPVDACRRLPSPRHEEGDHFAA